MSLLPTKGGCLTAEQFHFLFPNVRLTGLDWEITFDNGQFAMHFNGFYTTEELDQFRSDLTQVNVMCEECMEMFVEAERRIRVALGEDVGDVGSEALHRLRWDYLKMIKQEESTS